MYSHFSPSPYIVFMFRDIFGPLSSNNRRILGELKNKPHSPSYTQYRSAPQNHHSIHMWSSNCSQACWHIQCRYSCYHTIHLATSQVQPSLEQHKLASKQGQRYYTFLPWSGWPCIQIRHHSRQRCYHSVRTCCSMSSQVGWSIHCTYKGFRRIHLGRP